jgi:hypothetical protein
LSELIQAIREATADILRGEPAAKVLAETAELYRLRPELLRRKFEESHGPPETLFARQGAAHAKRIKRELSDAEMDRRIDAAAREIGLKPHRP